MDAISLLEKKLKKANVADRPGVLQGVYKQIVKSKKGRLCDGEYSTLIKDEDVKIKFGHYLFEQLNNYGLESHANRLYEQVLEGNVDKDYLEKLKEDVQSHHGS